MTRSPEINTGSVSLSINDRITLTSKIIQKPFIFAFPAIIGLLVMCPVILENSATYDEVAYARIACQWYRGEPSAEITRMGSPVTFWKVQSLPALLILDFQGREELISKPLKNLPQLLVWLRLSALWCWLVALWSTQTWAWFRYGPVAALLSGILFAFGPNLMAHGSLITMEMPLAAFWTLSLFLFETYLLKSRPAYLITAGLFAGLAFSMKFTGFLLPFFMASFIFMNRILNQQKLKKALLDSASVFLSVGFMIIATNLLVTGFATIGLSEQTGRHPWLDARFSPVTAERLGQILEMQFPVDWVGFITQMRHQSSGGPSYLFGQTSTTGWWYYYPVTIAVKVPLAILFLLCVRTASSIRSRSVLADLIPMISMMFLLLACSGSKRNYGFRYLFPLVPMMLVWVSSLFQRPGRLKWGLFISFILLVELMTAYPSPLVFFNQLAGGTTGGRQILADSNLDWGQGLISLKKLQKLRPELKDMTLFYFGDVEPSIYGVEGKIFRIDASDRFDNLPDKTEEPVSLFVGISTSLLNGPWGPPGYFEKYMWLEPLHYTSDGSIQIFEVSKKDHQ